MPTYTPLQSIELTSTTTSVVFSNIPQTYQDLVIIANGTTNTGSYFTLRLNGDTGNNYSNTEMDGSSSGAFTNRNTGNPYMYNGSFGTSQSNAINHIQNYSNSTTNKTVLTRSNYGTVGVKASVGLWRNTNAITSIECGTGGSNTFQTGTTFDLYGISPVAADTAQAFGGTEIYYDSTHIYHVFKGSGIFIPYRNLTVDILSIAGGGGGGFQIGAGGGAGGLLAHTAQSLTASTNYAVSVGAGGASNLSFGVSSQGGNSQFGSLTASVGGGGGAHGNDGGGVGYNGGNGGSGGGASQNNNSPSYTGGTGTAGQGNRGGNAQNGAGYSNGGGGGAGAAGTDSINTNLGVSGGAGVNTYSSWGLITSTGQNIGGTVWYAGGGGSGTGFNSAAGGNGGNGGGGNGGGGNTSFPISTSGTATTGGGGGGGGQRSGDNGANGGSGVVIVRYAR